MARQRKRTLKWCFIVLAEWLPIRAAMCPGHRICWVGRGQVVAWGGEHSSCWLLPWVGSLCISHHICSGRNLSSPHFQEPVKKCKQIKVSIFWRLVTYSGILVSVILEAISFPAPSAPLTWLYVTFLSFLERFSRIFLLPFLNGPGNPFRFFILLVLLERGIH